MSAGLIFYCVLGGLALVYLIFILTPAGKRWIRSWDK